MKILEDDGETEPLPVVFDFFAPTHRMDTSPPSPWNPEITTSKPDLALTSADTSIKVTVLLLTYAVYILVGAL